MLCVIGASECLNAYTYVGDGNGFPRITSPQGQNDPFKVGKPFDSRSKNEIPLELEP